MNIKTALLESIHESGISLLREFSQVVDLTQNSRDEILSEIQDYDVIIVKSVTEVDRQLLDRADKLKVIGRAGTGLDNIDVTEAEKRGISVYSVPTGNTKSAAEFTIMQILNLCRRTSQIINSVQNGDFRRHLMEGRELSELSVGLLGLGNMGIEVFKRLKPFGCNIIAWDPYSKNLETFKESGGALAESFDEFLSGIDLLSLHVSLNEETKFIINEDALQKVKENLMIVNNSRGDLIDEQALLDALESGKVSRVSLDVMSKPEPPYNLSPEDHDYSHFLLNHPKIFFTPHVAASTIDAQKKISECLVCLIKERFTK